MRWYDVGGRAGERAGYGETENTLDRLSAGEGDGADHGLGKRAGIGREPVRENPEHAGKYRNFNNLSHFI
jgi:hypothetical protein